MSAIPSIARAVIQPDPTCSKLEATTLPTPTLKGNNYLVRMKGSSPCLGELTWETAFPSLFENREHRVPGTEGAGIVVASPPNGKFKEGDEVIFRLDAWLHGTLREYTLIPAENVAPKPSSLSWTEASATPLSTLTAWQGVFEHAGLDPNGVSDAAARKANESKRVLVTGASGSVGMWALRFGSAAGGKMIGVGSGSKADEMRDAGAVEVIDYKRQSVDQWAAEGNEVDAVLDCTGKDLGKVWAAVKDGGRFLSVCVDPSQTKPEGKNAEVAKWYLVQPRGSDLAHIASLIDKNGWRPIIDSVVPFDQFQAAYDKVDGGRAAGKVVITIPE